jgi:hypothetical protein
MNSEVFQDTLGWLHGKQRRDSNEAAERRSELKQLTFRISKRLQGTWGTDIGEKYRQLRLDSNILQPQQRSPGTRNTARAKKRKPKRRVRKKKMRLSALSLELSSKSKSVELPEEGSPSLYASKNFGYMPQIFPNVDLRKISDDGRPLPHARLKNESHQRTVYRWFPSGPSTYTPLPEEGKKNIYGPYNSETLKIIPKKHKTFTKRRKRRAKSKYLIYDHNGVVHSPIRKKGSIGTSRQNPVGQRLLMQARERRGSLQWTYDKLNNAAISITNFFRNGRGIVQVWKWREQIRWGLWISYNATVINSKFARVYLAKQKVAEVRKVHEQAVKIQNAHRALIARRQLRHLRGLDKARRKFAERMRIKRSARIVQKAVKAHAKKKILHRFLGNTATSLQKRARGWLARKKNARKKNSHPEKGALQLAKDTVSAAKNKLHKIFFHRGGTEKHAVKIQARMRGHLTRRKIEQLKFDKAGYEYMHNGERKVKI